MRNWTPIKVSVVALVLSFVVGGMSLQGAGITGAGSSPQGNYDASFELHVPKNQGLGQTSSSPSPMQRTNASAPTQVSRVNFDADSYLRQADTQLTALSQMDLSAAHLKEFESKRRELTASLNNSINFLEMINNSISNPSELYSFTGRRPQDVAFNELYNEAVGGFPSGFKNTIQNINSFKNKVAQAKPQQTVARANLNPESYKKWFVEYKSGLDKLDPKAEGFSGEDGNIVMPLISEMKTKTDSVISHLEDMMNIEDNADFNKMAEEYNSMMNDSFLTPYYKLNAALNTARQNVKNQVQQKSTVSRVAFDTAAAQKWFYDFKATLNNKIYPETYSFSATDRDTIRNLMSQLHTKSDKIIAHLQSMKSVKDDAKFNQMANEYNAMVNEFLVPYGEYNTALTQARNNAAMVTY